jgi:hypothetical protein
MKGAQEFPEFAVVDDSKFPDSVGKHYERRWESEQEIRLFKLGTAIERSHHEGPIDEEFKIQLYSV